MQQLYVNGVRVDRPRAPTTVWVDGEPVQALCPVPGRFIVEELRRIPADQIVEIRYADRRDPSVPFYMQYALYVTLKPPPRQVQDSMLRSLGRSSGRGD